MSARDHLHPQQLKMFMSANEILGTYHPLEGDRWGTSEDEPTDQRANSRTLRTHRTDGVSNYPDYSEDGVFRRRENYERRPETDDELWERKLDEAGDRGLDLEIGWHGVQKPVHLGERGGSRDVGPTVLGGHHRIAVMRDQAPDELMPVLHHTDLWSAKTGIMNGKYPYS